MLENLERYTFEMSNKFELGEMSRQPTAQEITAKAERILDHTDRTGERDAEAWAAHLEAVVGDLYAFSQGANLQDEMYENIPKVYPGYTAEDFATLLGKLEGTDVNVKRYLETIRNNPR